MTATDIDVAIIGAGTAGLSARSEVAAVTDSYRVFDPGPLGTTCARVGCMPSKALIQIANDFHRRRVFAQMGITGGDGLGIDGAQVMQSVRKLRDDFVEGVIEGMQHWRETHLVKSRACFDDDGLLSAGGVAFRPRRTILATGSSPVVPPDWRDALGDRIITTDDLFDMEDLPRRLGVVGLGPVGLELGQAMARLGVEVTAVDPGRGLGGLADKRLQDMAVDHFAGEFHLVTGKADPKAAGDAVQLCWDGGAAEVDQLLVAVGRRPNVDALNLGALGLPCDDDGVPVFDPRTGRIGDSDLYIAGDVTDELPVLHEAADGGRIAGWNAARNDDHVFVRRVRMQVSFSEPQVAHVGATPDELSESGEEVVTGHAGFEDQGRARIARVAEGAVCIHLRKSDGRILGADLFSPRAEHFAHLLARAMQEEATAQSLLRTPFYHPTFEEGLRSALRDGAGKTDAGMAGIEAMRCETAPVEA